MGGAKIASYINNLNPETNQPLYAAIEQVISKAVPMWSLAVRSTLYLHERSRLVIDGDGYDHEAGEAATRDLLKSQAETRKDKSRKSLRDHHEHDREQADGEDTDEKHVKPDERDDDKSDEQSDGQGDKQSEELADEQDGDDNDDGYDSDEDNEIWQEEWKGKYIMVPEPDHYERRERVYDPRREHEYSESWISEHQSTGDFDRTFPEEGFQVIVKLVNIHLTPENPTFDGGAPWHIEGLPNEHICASAVYYYDSSNIVDSHLEFRENVDSNYVALNVNEDGPHYDLKHEQGLREIFGTREQGSVGIQVLGKVLVQEGRLIVYPNVLQRKVLPFKLDNASKPGHRKMLALFLVDPDIRIPSTSNVPPQQRDWRAR